MGVAQTLTDIANLALASLGERQITNIDADGKTENLIRIQLYESIRQTQLEIFWEELIISVKPSKSPDEYEPANGYAIYNLPNNFLDAVGLANSYARWFLEGGKLITTDADPLLSYKRYSEDPSEWSGYLVELVYKRLAMNIAMAVTQNANILSQATQLYNMAKGDNLMRSANRQRDYSEKPERFDWMRTRSRRHGAIR